jgi:xylitol oxidase
VVSLGALGIVTRMTLAVEPTFTIRQYVYEDLPRAELVEHWEQVLGAGYSVSLFTTWSGPAVHQVWLKLRDDDPVTPAPWAGPAPERWFGARRAEAPRHPIPGVSAVHCTEQLGRPGPWHERLPHFRLEFTPSAGDELQSEFFVPRHRALEAFAAVESLADQVAPVLQISEIRTVAADDLWLSPAYQCDSLALHFTWIADPTAVAPVLAAVSERLAPLGARPHWGKLLPADPGDLSRLYGRWADFDALVRRYDPAGVFRNPMLTELFGP